MIPEIVRLHGENYGILVVGSVLDDEITDRRGYDKHESGASRDGNSRNCTRSRTVTTKAGRDRIDAPRGHAGNFTPQIVARRQHRLGAIADIVLSLSSRGMTQGDISAHLADVYGSEVSKTTILTITDKVINVMKSSPPLGRLVSGSSPLQEYFGRNRSGSWPAATLMGAIVTQIWQSVLITMPSPPPAIRFSRTCAQTPCSDYRLKFL